MSPKTPTTKYLAGYAEAEVRQRLSLPRSYRTVACIPACDEADNLPATLTHLAQAEGACDALVVVVLNGREDAPERVHEANLRTAQHLRSQADLPRQSMAHGTYHGMGLVLVDRFSPGQRLPHKQGVGMARKIAADLALGWMEDGRIERRWIRSTDADVRVPPDYWEQPDQARPGTSACVYPFKHLPEGDALQRQALACYDAYLRYYVAGLKRAGSAYAYATIGSLLCLDADAYAKVRGFPKKQAGEDFYILNKLAKVGRIETLSSAPLELAGRTSDRVPFGTGVAVAQIRTQLAQGQDYQVYNPQIFDALKVWLTALDDAGEHGDIERFEEGLKTLPELVRTAAQSNAFIEPIRQAIRTVQGPVLRKRLHDWNDAFRTLKMVHALRDAGLGMVPAHEALTPWLTKATNDV